MPHLSVSLFGPFQATLDSQPVTSFESNKVRALLAYLVVEARSAHSREKLAGLLWPDWPDQAALTNLRHVLASLRLAINDRQAKPPFLTISRNTIQFNQDSQYDLDVESFENQIALGGKSPGRESSSAISQLHAACSLYQASFLDGFTCDSAAFEEWALLKREHLHRQLLKALDQLVKHHTELREYEQAQLYARRQVELEPWLEEAHQQLMRLLALDGQRSAALAQYEICCRLLKQELGVEPAQETTVLYNSIRDQTFPPPSALQSGSRLSAGEPVEIDLEPPAPGEPPFKGLHFFVESDAHLFFGRERLTAQLASRVSECLSVDHAGTRFLAVIGASGSGKSSIIRAGLVPALKSQPAPAPTQTARFFSPSPTDQAPTATTIPFPGPIHVITPTACPLEALALSLAQPDESVTAIAGLSDQLAADPRSLHLAAARAARFQGASRLLLVVDQFEELFSLCHHETERKAFVDNLIYAAGDSGATVVVIALRADFYAHCAPYEELRQALCQRQEYIGAMTSEELRRAITEPAARAGWTFEPGLVDLLLRDVGNEPGALPLLSHALLETWQRRTDRTLSLAGYTAAGGVHGAIARTAETTYCQLTPEQQFITRNIFLRLTGLGEESGDTDLPWLYTRRRALLSELLSQPQDAPQVQVVIQKLTDARLISIAQETVEVAHEALIREWATLREWLNENREGLRLHRHLTEAAQEWDKLNQDTGALYRGARLAQTLAWAEAHAADLNTLERLFLEASLAEQQAQQEAESAHQRRELEAAQNLVEAQRQRAETETRRAEEQARSASKLRQRAIYLALALGASLILLLAAVWLGQMANRNAQAAQGQARLAASRELAAAAVNNLQVDPQRSVLLALQALSTADTLEARNSLHQALPELHILHSIPAHKQAPGLAFSPDGTRLVSIGIDGTLKVWDASNSQAQLTISGEPGDIGFTVAYSPNGKFLAAMYQTKAVLWDASSGQKMFTLPGDSIGPTITRLAFSPDGTRLAIANMDGVPKVWDLSSHALLFSLVGHKQPCDGIAYSPDGRRLATGDEGGVIKVWDAVTGQELFSFGQGGALHSLAFSPDGQRLASANEDGTLKVWDPTTGLDLLSTRHKSGLYDLAFLPDGKRLVTAHQDGTAHIWDVVSGEDILTLAGHVSTVVSLAVSPDGGRIATSGYDGEVKIWETTPGRELLTLAAHNDQAWDVAYSPDGTRLGSISLDGTARLWHPLSGQLVLSSTQASFAGELTGLAFSPDGRRLATGALTGMVTVWDISANQIVITLTGHLDRVTGLAFSPDGTRLATSSWDGTAKVWDVSTALNTGVSTALNTSLAGGKEIVTFSGHGKNIVMAIAFSPDGRHVFTGGTDGFVREWDATSGQEVQSFSGEEKEVYGVALSPDGRLLAMGRQDGVVTAWEVSSGKKMLQLSGHAGLVVRLAFNKDGTRLASAGFDGFAKVWDVQNGQELGTLYGNRGNVFGVSFSPDGAHLATAGGDGTVRTYTLQLDDLISLARSRLTRSLTTEECRKYLHAAQCPVTP